MLSLVIFVSVSITVGGVMKYVYQNPDKSYNEIKEFTSKLMEVKE